MNLDLVLRMMCHNAAVPTPAAVTLSGILQKHIRGLKCEKNTGSLLYLTTLPVTSACHYGGAHVGGRLSGLY